LNEAQARGDLEKASAQAEGTKLIGTAVGKGLTWRVLALDRIDELIKKAANIIRNIKIEKLVVWDTGKGRQSVIMDAIKESLSQIPYDSKQSK